MREHQETFTIKSFVVRSTKKGFPRQALFVNEVDNAIHGICKRSYFLN